MATKKDKIIDWISREKQIKTKDLVERFGVSRQYAIVIANLLVSEGRLIKTGSTKNAKYISTSFALSHPEVLPTRFSRAYKNENLEEHKVLDEVESTLALVERLAENVRSIFTFAFSEMINNAIEHSGAGLIRVEVILNNDKLLFTVNDSGIGVFRSIMRKRKLRSELEAIQDLLKGKTTTMPKSHSGEGIFFTSKVAERFVLDSFDRKLVIDNKRNDVSVGELERNKRGTRVVFEIPTTSTAHLQDIFKKYTNINNQSDYGFDRTEVKIHLYSMGGVCVSRSQARRVLTGLQKFKSIIFDFDQVPMIGQAFADEIFRVFHNRHPDIELQTTNMNDGIRFMVERVEGGKVKGQKKLFDSHD